MNLQTAWAWLKAEVLSYPMWAPAAAAAVIAQGTTLSWWHLTGDQTGEVTAVVVAVLGLAAAFLTRNVGVTVIVTALQAVGALTIGFHFHGAQTVGLYIGAVVTLLGWFGHQANSPKYGRLAASPTVGGPVTQPGDSTATTLRGAAKTAHQRRLAREAAAGSPEDGVS